MTKKMCFKTKERIRNTSWPIKQEICIGLTVFQKVSTFPVIVKGQEYMEHTAFEICFSLIRYLMWCRSPASADKK